MKLNKKLIIPIIGAYPDIGKGTLASAIGYILQKNGFNVTIAKFDGYFNINSGNMNPYHKNPSFLYSNEEIFVLKDGYETDADHGYYERFLNKELTSESCITNGKILNELLEKIKNKEYRFGEVLKYKNLRDLLKQKIYSFFKKFDILVLEIGGTIGDEETAQLYKSLQEIYQEGRLDFKTIMISPYFSDNFQDGIELSSRTKITRKSFLEARSYGLTPNIIFLRSHVGLLKNDVEYISSDCSISKECILLNPQVLDVYQLPKIIEKQGLMNLLFQKIKFKKIEGRLEKYARIKNKIKNEKTKSIKIGIFGKTLYDSYISLIEAIEHAGIANGKKTEIIWLDDLVNRKISIKGFDGIIIAEGLSYTNEKLEIILTARESDVPLLAISFGCDLIIKEFVENELKINVAINEIEKPSKLNIKNSELILGEEEVRLKKDSFIGKIYGAFQSTERYRNCSYISEKLTKFLNVLDIVGVNSKLQPVAFELKNKKFYIGVKFHPEYKSRPGKPHPIFVEFIKQCSSKSIKDNPHGLPEFSIDLKNQNTKLKNDNRC